MIGNTMITPSLLFITPLTGFTVIINMTPKAKPVKISILMSRMSQ